MISNISSIAFSRSILVIPLISHNTRSNILNFFTAASKPCA